MAEMCQSSPPNCSPFAIEEGRISQIFLQSGPDSLSLNISTQFAVRHIRCRLKLISREQNWVIKPVNGASTTMLTQPAVPADLSNSVLCSSWNTLRINGAVHKDVNNLKVILYLESTILKYRRLDFLIGLFQIIV